MRIEHCCRHARDDLVCGCAARAVERGDYGFRAANTSGDYIFISAITLIEIRYLVEKNRIKASVLARIEQELDEPDPMVVVAPLDRAVSDALALIPRTVVSDMPDRIIAATAHALSLPLITRERR